MPRRTNTKPGEDFQEAAEAAGFTDDQIEFLSEWLAARPHTHTTGDIILDEGSDEEQTLTDFIEDLEG